MGDGAHHSIPWLIWMTGRRALPGGKSGKASTSYRQAAGWLAVLIIFGTGWLLANRYVYQIPSFVAENGILVARFEGDPTDQQQIDFANSLIVNDPNRLEEGEQRVQVLPIRIGFPSIGRANLLDKGHLEARKYGGDAQAAVVLWGKLLAPQETMGRLAINLTFIKNEALYRSLKPEAVGAMDASELNDLDSSLSRLAKSLPQFLEGYRRYHAAESERDFELAKEAFSYAIKAIESNLEENISDRPILEQILASLHFYRGNTFLVLGHIAEASNNFEAAIGLTADVVDGPPRYYEAAINLGWLLRREGKLDKAVAVLEAVDSKCESDRPQKRACAYAWYNLGYALSDQGLHEQASVYFKLAIKRIQNTYPDTGGTGDRLLEAFCHQNLAYSLVLRATTMDVDVSASLLEDAQKASKRGQDVLKHAGLDVPKYFQITIGRIHIERHDWKSAIDVLTNLEVPQDFKASVHALLAGAYHCDGKVEQTQKHLYDLVASGTAGLSNDGFRISITEGMKEVARIKKMCGEASYTGS
jgi:tetratricopeptide (TPR) repeat protein